MFLICNSIPSRRRKKIKYETCENSKQPHRSFCSWFFSFDVACKIRSIDKIVFRLGEQCLQIVRIFHQMKPFDETLSSLLKLNQTSFRSRHDFIWWMITRKVFHAKAKVFFYYNHQRFFQAFVSEKGSKKKSLSFLPSTFVRVKTWRTASKAKIWISIYI